MHDESTHTTHQRQRLLILTLKSHTGICVARSLPLKRKIWGLTNNLFVLIARTEVESLAPIFYLLMSSRFDFFVHDESTQTHTLTSEPAYLDSLKALGRLCHKVTLSAGAKMVFLHTLGRLFFVLIPICSFSVVSSSALAEDIGAIIIILTKIQWYIVQW